MKNSLLLFIFLFIISCQKDVENITIKGIIFDTYTHKPIKNKVIGIEIVCWKYGNKHSSDPSYAEHELRRILVDSNGNYSVSFNQGALVTFDISTDGYGRYQKSFYIKNSEVTHNIDLIPL